MSAAQEMEARAQAILIVDDHRENLIAMRRLLEGLDAELVTAQSGREALSAVLRGDFAVALLDVQMPEMDGYELASLLRDEPGTKNLPIIFLSAVYSDDYYRIKGIESGAVDFISKPFPPEVLVGKVRIFLEMHRYRTQLEKLVAIRAADLARANQELATLVDRLERRNQQLGEFAHISAHHLQEPTRQLTMACQMLRRDLGEALSEELERDCASILERSRRMQDLVSGLAQLAELGRLTGKPAVLSVNQCVERALETLTPQIDAAQAEFIREDLPDILGHAAVIQRLFRNLIENALKFVPPGVRPVIRLTGERRASDCLFGVHDNGIGVEARYFEKIFSPFERLHAATEYGGTGIGLSLCRRIIDLHGGRIWIRSKPGGGSSFYFTIPDGADGELR